MFSAVATKGRSVTGTEAPGTICGRKRAKTLTESASHLLPNSVALVSNSFLLLLVRHLLLVASNALCTALCY